ncbi:hypothetical protein AQUCO_02100136v1 [Aquilegia coerulea]|uniref:HTH myb-type domain-containing protein n=1 Tax=Aquilegia coerulea TaxID=218851 RepID=A0A2G5DF20_AQUCA|nr:hypothetical protein AQUCO_02100136v1 [Aquilegia coerulea]
MWQFVYTENVEYFQGIYIEQGLPPPPPPPIFPQDRSSSLSISDDINRQGRNSSSSSSTSNGKKRRQDDGYDCKKQKRPYKKHGKEDQDLGKTSAAVPLKKTRVVWTSQLHENFLQALSILSMGRKRVVPKRILALMNVRGLSRGNVASHLQKYRMYQNKYKGTSGSDYPSRRIRMRLPDETEYHDYSPSQDHYSYQDQLGLAGLQDNFCPPNNFNHVPLVRPQYHFQEGSNDNFMPQANYEHPDAITNPGYLEKPWMSGAPTMNQSNVGVYPGLFGTSAPLYCNDMNIGSTTNGTPLMAEQRITQGNAGFLLNAPLDPNFGNLGFESQHNSPSSVDIGNMGPFGAWNELLTETMGGEIPNNDNSADKGKKIVEEPEDEFSFPDNPLYFNGMNFNLTSQAEPFVVNPNYAVVGESSTRALVNPNKLQSGSEVNNNSWCNSVDDIVDFLFNQGSENANEACVIPLNP